MVSLSDGTIDPALIFSTNSLHSGGTARGSVRDAPGSNERPLNQSYEQKYFTSQIRKKVELTNA